MAWGLWRIPESDLNVLGDVRALAVLELGCGAARWSIALCRAGAFPTGLDLSPKQLGHARRLMDEANVNFPLVEGSAESIPLQDASFDIVFCDWGAITFSDPYLTIPEAFRVLRRGGLLAFASASPIQFLCRDRQTDLLTTTLLNPYFGLHKVEWDDEVNFQLPYSRWIKLFRDTGFVIEDLIETQPPAGSETSYQEPEEVVWSSQWPMEAIWRVRKPE